MIFDRNFWGRVFASELRLTSGNVSGKLPSMFDMTYDFLQKFLGTGFCLGIAVDVRQCFRQTALYGGQK